MCWPEFHKATLSTKSVNTDGLLLGVPICKVCTLLTQTANPGRVPLFHKKERLRIAQWLICGCHTKGVKDSDIINGLETEPLAGALPFTLRHLLIFRRAETSQQDLSLVDRSSEAGIQPLKDFVVLYMSSVTTNTLGRLLSMAD